MKYIPEKKYELSVPLTIPEITEKLMQSVSEKKLKKGKDPDFCYFFGKVADGKMELAPNKGVLSGYIPTLKGDMTSVTESKPSTEGAGAFYNSFTRIGLDMNMSKGSTAFSYLWIGLCAVVMILSLWLNFAKGFKSNWWTLLIAPVLFLGERIACNIGFRTNARRIFKTVKDILKN